MTDCNISIPLVTLVDSKLDVSTKVQILTNEALGAESIYMRAKDTFKELLEGRHLSEADYAQFASQFISQLAVSITQQVITGAIQWAQHEQEMAYNLAAIKVQMEVNLIQIEQTKANICKTEKETALTCANITATLATSIRKNGRVATYADDGCTPLTLYAEGSEYSQMLAIEANKYSTLADSYRKSGIVDIAIIDGVEKGVSGNNAGYTDAQEEFARRQVKSFEDSKRNHAANASSQMIGQLLSAEIAPDPQYVTQWNTAMSYLNTNTP